MTERRRFPCRSFPSAINGELAKLVLHNPPQNRLTRAFFAELGETIAEIGRSGARAALLSAEGPDFLRRRHRLLTTAAPSVVRRNELMPRAGSSARNRPSCTFQIFMVTSTGAAMMLEPSGLNAKVLP
jgi:hypothetical protein